jgi:hypothetical protein
MKNLDQKLLDKIAVDNGFNSVEELFKSCTFEQAYGVCKSCFCTIECEPDATKNWCPNCDKKEVVSALVLGGLI